MNKIKFKRLLFITLITVLCFNSIAYANQGTKKIGNSNVKIRIEKIEFDNDKENLRNAVVVKDDGGGGGGGVLLYVTYKGVEKVFQVTQHAVERISERFAGNYNSIGNILANGDIYADVAHDGYVAYYAKNAVCLTSDFTVIKTVEDNVSLVEKLANKIWSWLSNTISIW